MSSYVHTAIADVPGIPATEREHLHATRHAIVLSHLRTMMDPTYLRRVLGGATTPWFVLKGLTLAEPDRRAQGGAEATCPLVLGPAADEIPITVTGTTWRAHVLSRPRPTCRPNGSRTLPMVHSRNRSLPPTNGRTLAQLPP